MKTKFLAAALMGMCSVSFASAEVINISAGRFPDVNFRNYVQTNFDTNGDWKLQESEVQAVTSIDCSSKEIASLGGINVFKQLEELNCSSNQIATLDLSSNPALKKLNCSGDSITSLTVSGLENLREINCSNNKLAALDVATNPNLQILTCDYNNLTELNVTSNKHLTNLSFSRNSISTIDLSQNAYLYLLVGISNKLTSIDVSACPSIYRLECYSNEIESINVANCADLNYLALDGNKLTSIDVSQCPKLETLSLYGNQIRELDVTNNVALTKLSVSANKLSSLDVTNNVNLSRLFYYNNNINAIDLSKNTLITHNNAYKKEYFGMKQTPNGRIIGFVDSYIDASNKQVFYIVKSKMASLMGENTSTSLAADGFDINKVTYDEYAVGEGEVDGLAAGTVIYKLDPDVASTSNSGYSHMLYKYNTGHMNYDGWKNPEFYLDWIPLKAVPTSAANSKLATTESGDVGMVNGCDLSYSVTAAPEGYTAFTRVLVIDADGNETELVGYADDIEKTIFAAGLDGYTKWRTETVYVPTSKVPDTIPDDFNPAEIDGAHKVVSPTADIVVADDVPAADIQSTTRTSADSKTGSYSYNLQWNVNADSEDILKAITKFYVTVEDSKTGLTETVTVTPDRITIVKNDDGTFTASYEVSEITFEGGTTFAQGGADHSFEVIPIYNEIVPADASAIDSLSGFANGDLYEKKGDSDTSTSAVTWLGVNGIEVDSAHATEVFTTTGVKVSSVTTALPAGIYIIKDNGTTVKVLIQ